MSTVKHGRPSKKPDSGAITALAPTATVTDFGFNDNLNNTYTVVGYDANGNVTSLKNSAKLSITSSDPSIILPENAAGDTFKIVPRKMGSVSLSVIVTYLNGKAGPFTITVPMTVTGFLGVELVPVISDVITIAP